MTLDSLTDNLFKEINPLLAFNIAVLYFVIKKISMMCKGAYSVILMIQNYGLIAFRDIHGIRPLIYGKKFTNYLIMIYSLSLLPFSLFFWLNGTASNYFAIIAIGLASIFLYLIYSSFKNNDKYKIAFLFSIIYMLLIHISLISDIVF